MVKVRHEATGKVPPELPSCRANGHKHRQSANEYLRLAMSLALQLAGFLLEMVTHSMSHTREAKQVSKGIEHYRHNVPYQPISLSHILSQRPNWRTEYELQDWLPSWLSKESVVSWKSRRHDANHQRALDVELQLGRDDYFWKTMVDAYSRNFTFAIASNGFGHRLGNLAMSYFCNVVPNKRQQIIFWDTPGNNTMRVEELCKTVLY